MSTFEEAEAQILAALDDAGALKKLWKVLDYNGNNIVSVAEVDKFLGENFPVLKHQPTIIRAFKYTTLIDGDKDSWVEKFEFPSLLRNILYFHKVYTVFEKLDEDGDHRISRDEFKANIATLGLELTDEQADTEFDVMDDDGHGMVLFAELCRWFAVKAKPIGGDVRTQFTTYADKATDEKRSVHKKKLMDRDPDIHTKKFKKVEKKIASLLKSKRQMAAMWKILDYNGNGIVSLAEVDKFTMEQFPMIHCPRANIRAFKYTTMVDGDGDEWIEPDEFPFLLRNLIYFNKIYDAFDRIDSDDDHRIDLAEFKVGLGHVGLALSDKDAELEFMAMDSNMGGVVLFDEFAAWCAQRACPVDGDVRKHFVLASKEMRRKVRSGAVKAPKMKRSVSSKFAGAIQTITSKISDETKLKLLWRKLDASADGHLSLGELAKYMGGKYPLLGRKVALKRAYQFTIKNDSEDDNATIEENEFPALLQNVVLFHKILHTFDTIDGDGSHKIDANEFHDGLELLHLSQGKDADVALFKQLDKDGSGALTLTEFSSYAVAHESELLAA